MIFLYVLYYFIVNSNDISMVDEKTHPNYLSLLSYIIYYIIRAFGTHNVIYYVLEQGHVIWIRFFIHHTNKPLLSIIQNFVANPSKMKNYLIRLRNRNSKSNKKFDGSKKNVTMCTSGKKFMKIE